MSHLLQKYPSDRAPSPATIGAGLLFRHPYHNCGEENIIDCLLKYSIFIEADDLLITGRTPFGSGSNSGEKISGCLQPSLQLLSPVVLE
jgi:hypothetical protein